MNDNIKKCNIIIFFLIFISVFSAIIPLFFISNNFIAYADSGASNVLDDLQKDSSFNTSHYPLVADDFSLNLIQIAESTDKELLIYVYQPSGTNKNLIASSINISSTINDNISFYNYKLQLLNSSGVFYKYLVKDFTLKSDSTRYYAISSIYRPFDELIDDAPEHGNLVTEIDYAVNKQYCFSVINGQPYCSVVDIETIVVTDKFVGFVRYSDGFKFYAGACDSHFVAFNTDKPIDKLLEADVYYTSQSYGWMRNMLGQETESFGESKDAYSYLEYTDKVEHTGDGLFAGTYKWDRIETVDQFLSENNIKQTVFSGAILDVNVANKITEEGIAALQGKKWVLRFVETPFSYYTYNGASSINTTLIGEVTILRLKFETDGITYNLGVIDNKQTGSNKPINQEEIKPEINDNGKLFLIILAIILLAIILILFRPIISALLKFIFWIVALPFRLLGAISKSIFNAMKSNKTKKNSPEGKNIRQINKGVKKHEK